MTRTLLTLRAVVSIAAVAALAACSDSSPTAATEPSASFARGSGGGAATTQSSTLSRSAGALFANAKGKAKFASKAGERELQIEVENVPAGTALVFSVGGASVGSASADSFGKARINLNSTLGATVPMSVTGAAVVVTTAAGGAVVSGSF